MTVEKRKRGSAQLPVRRVELESLYRRGLEKKRERSGSEREGGWMIGRAWRSGRRMRLFYGVYICICMCVGAPVCLVATESCWLPVEKRESVGKESVFFIMEAAAAGLLMAVTYEIAAAAAAAGYLGMEKPPCFLPCTANQSSELLEIQCLPFLSFSTTRGTLSWLDVCVCCHEVKRECSLFLSPSHMTDDFIDLFDSFPLFGRGFPPIFLSLWHRNSNDPHHHQLMSGRR